MVEEQEQEQERYLVFVRFAKRIRLEVSGGLEAGDDGFESEWSSDFSLRSNN